MERDENLKSFVFVKYDDNFNKVFLSGDL
uniref:Uncharacterized protein n=1 Tax=Lepeophtheirus salmonis TaxID=72036 RepID=A0A0K2VLX8_LEPSM